MQSGFLSVGVLTDQNIKPPLATQNKGGVVQCSVIAGIDAQFTDKFAIGNFFKILTDYLISFTDKWEWLREVVFGSHAFRNTFEYKNKRSWKISSTKIKTINN